jgi:hypothetical protein
MALNNSGETLFVLRDAGVEEGGDEEDGESYYVEVAASDGDTWLFLPNASKRSNWP